MTVFAIYEDVTVTAVYCNNYRELLRSHVAAQGLFKLLASETPAVTDGPEPPGGPLVDRIRGQGGIEGRVRREEEGVEPGVLPCVRSVHGKVPPE